MQILTTHASNIATKTHLDKKQKQCCTLSKAQKIRTKIGSINEKEN
jgi:hypothetical protein